MAMQTKVTNMMVKLTIESIDTKLNMLTQDISSVKSENSDERRIRLNDVRTTLLHICNQLVYVSENISINRSEDVSWEDIYTLYQTIASANANILMCVTSECPHYIRVRHLDCAVRDLNLLRVDLGNLALSLD